MKTLDKAIDKVDINNEEKIDFKISVSDFDITESYFTDEDEIDNKTIKYIEREIRNSFEYRTYIQFLKEELDLTRCSLMKNIDIKTTPVSLEFHHFPLTLYEITEAVGKSMVDGLTKDEAVSGFDIAEKVVEEHYKHNIGLVPLTKTIHDMAHNGTIFIPIDAVNGNYQEFINDYRKHIEPATLDKVEAVKAYNNSQTAKDYNQEKLKKRIVNYDVEYKDHKKDEEGGNTNGII